MKQKDVNKTLALAGIFQAAFLVKQYALTGQIDEVAYQSCLASIFKIDSPDVISIFGEINHLHIGLLSLINFGKKKPPFKDSALLQYVLHMITLGKRLLKDQELAKQLSRRLGPAISQASHFSPDHPLVLHNLATIYNRTFIERQLRIPVVGRRDLLKQAPVTEKIRALLLAGIRAALLWYQVGGNRWELFFSRRKYSKYANALLYPLPHNLSPQAK